MKITLDDIRQMVLECVERIMENTNMKSLYHFTTLSSLSEIVKTNKLKAANYVKDYWDNNLHISFTRHKSNLEGFASVNEKTVRIQFNVEKLNSRHGIIRIKPMEFYSPNRHGPYLASTPMHPYTTSKAFYQDPYRRGEHGDRIEFHNQAEEGVQIYDSGINHLNRYVDRVDILFEGFMEACSNYGEWIGTLSLFYEINSSRFANFVPIFVYSESKHFVLQDNHCMKLSDMVEYFENNVCDIKYESGKRLEKFLGDISQL